MRQHLCNLNVIAAKFQVVKCVQLWQKSEIITSQSLHARCSKTFSACSPRVPARGVTANLLTRQSLLTLPRTWSGVEDCGFQVTFPGSCLFCAPVNLCPFRPGLPLGTAPCPAAAPSGRALISVVASSLWCCDSPAPWQGQPWSAVNLQTITPHNTSFFY